MKERFKGLTAASCATVFFLLPACSSLPELRAEPPPREERKDISLRISGGTYNKSGKELQFYEELSSHSRALLEHSNYFSSVSLDNGVDALPYPYVHIRYSVAYIAPQGHTNPEGFRTDFVDFETQAMCCLTAGLVPSHQTYQIYVDMELAVTAEDVQTIKKSDTWGAWLYQPLLIPVYTNLAGRLEQALLELVADSLEAAREEGLI